MKRVPILIVGLLSACVLLGASGVAPAGAGTTVTVAMHNARTEEIVWGIANRIKEHIEKTSQGAMSVRLLGPEVGGERELLEGTSRNEFQIVQSGDMGIAIYAPKYAVTSVPFVFPDYSYVQKAYEGKLGQKLNEAMIQNGNMRLLGLSRRGARLLTGKKAMPTPAEVKGLKLRVPEIATWVAAWKEIGALPTPVAWPEVFTALQTGVVDAQENPILQIYEAKLYEVQKYVMMTEHLCAYFHWFGNEKFLQGLPADQRRIVEDAVKQAVAWGSSKQEEKSAELRSILEKQHRVQFVNVDKQKFFGGARPAIDRIAAQQWAPEVKDLLKDILGW
jgi:tripartite ATP-independent transporter DctP family solute receptor